MYYSHSLSYINFKFEKSTHNPSVLFWIQYDVTLKFRHVSPSVLYGCQVYAIEYNFLVNMIFCGLYQGPENSSYFFGFFVTLFWGFEVRYLIYLYRNKVKWVKFENLYCILSLPQGKCEHCVLSIFHIYFLYIILCKIYKRDR